MKDISFELEILSHYYDSEISVVKMFNELKMEIREDKLNDLGL